uniref:Uncharacterized protein n=1 Tax=Arundo donax TaxID=35708 RepID=A0A0A8ZZ65_ARUDO
MYYECPSKTLHQTLKPRFARYSKIEPIFWTAHGFPHNF